MARRALYGFDPTRLIEVRRERGLSRSDLGRIADVPYNTLRRWETANAAPAPELLKRVADALGVELSELAVIPTAAATLASRRNEKGLTQLEVAAALGMSKSTYSRLERGERKATKDDIRRLAEALEESDAAVRELWTRANQRPGIAQRR